MEDSGMPPDVALFLYEYHNSWPAGSFPTSPEQVKFSCCPSTAVMNPLLTTLDGAISKLESVVNVVGAFTRTVNRDVFCATALII